MANLHYDLTLCEVMIDASCVRSVEDDLPVARGSSRPRTSLRSTEIACLFHGVLKSKRLLIAGIVEAERNISYPATNKQNKQTQRERKR